MNPKIFNNLYNLIHIYINNSKCFHQKVDHLDTQFFFLQGNQNDTVVF